MKVVITAATVNEWKQIQSVLLENDIPKYSRLAVEFHTSGVGILSSTFSLTKLIYEEKPDLIIQVGICGAYDNTISLGDVVVVKEEYLGDTGVEEKYFKDVFDLKLENADSFPYKRKALTNLQLKKYNLLELPVVKGITINEITTRVERIKQLKEKYGADVESMEGAALHYASLSTQTSFIQIRAISNYVGERDRAKWMLEEALKNLEVAIVKYIDNLNQMENEQLTTAITNDKLKRTKKI